jgi:RepB DNA-primase from phage plasmid
MHKKKGRGLVSDTAAALRMLDTFTSVGAKSFVVTKTDINQKLIWGKTYPADKLRQLMPAMVRTAAIRKPCPIPDGKSIMAGENLIIRPTGPDVALVQLDDLSSAQLDRVRPAVFIIHATSPGNHQAWIAVSGVPEGKEQFKEFTRRVRKAVGGTDKSASHATRIAGTENFKVKYAPAFPTVTIVETHPGRVMTPPQLEALGLLSPPEPVAAPPLKFTRRIESSSDKIRQWPSYEKALTGAPQGADGSGPDRSRADFWWSYLALQRGWSPEDTEAKLVEVSEKARERVRLGDEGYVHVTVANAQAWLERSRQQSRA